MKRRGEAYNGASALVGVDGAGDPLDPRPSSVPRQRFGVAWTTPEGGAGLCFPPAMKARVLPYYRFYVLDFRASRNVSRLSYVERGLYRDLIDECWIEGGIPDDIPRLADICGCPVKVMRGAWANLAKFFEPIEGHAGQLSSARLECERTEQDSRRTQASLAGKRSAEARATPRERPSTTVERESTSSSSSSSSSIAKQSSSSNGPLVTQAAEQPTAQPVKLAAVLATLKSQAP